MLEIQNLMVFFENALALNDFSMEVKEGEIVGVIGSNSAGKTTLMNTVSGLIIDMKIKEQRKGGERITIYGEIIFNGQDITDTHPYHRVKMGLVLARERHPIFPESDVIENLKIAGHQRTKSEIKEMTQYAFTLFPALSQLRRRKAGFLSGGEQQMLSIGMALVTKPTLLLLDEPLSIMGSMGRANCSVMKMVIPDSLLRFWIASTSMVCSMGLRPNRGSSKRRWVLSLPGRGIPYFRKVM